MVDNRVAVPHQFLKLLMLLMGCKRAVLERNQQQRQLHNRICQSGYYSNPTSPYCYVVSGEMFSTSVSFPCGRDILQNHSHFYVISF